MEHLVDLDALAGRLTSVVEEWRCRATVGPLTWHDEVAGWPRPIASDRSTVQVPDSLGFTLQPHATEGELDIVIWTGGWADVGYMLDGEICNSCPEFQDVDGAHAAVVQEVESFLELGRARPRR